MNKGELVALVAATSGTSASDAEKVLNGFRDVVQAKVKSGEEITYPGLGKWSRVARKARTARNPRTGETVKVAASKAPKFTAAAGLRNVVNGKATAPKLPKVKAAK